MTNSDDVNRIARKVLRAIGMDDDGLKNGRVKKIRTVDRMLYAPGSMDTTDMRTAAFNEGCQARIDGYPLRENPHETLTVEGKTRWRSWREGWMDVDVNWGKGVGGRWRHLELKRCG